MNFYFNWNLKILAYFLIYSNKLKISYKLLDYFK